MSLITAAFGLATPVVSYLFAKAHIDKTKAEAKLDTVAAASQVFLGAAKKVAEGQNLDGNDVKSIVGAAESFCATVQATKASK